MRANSGNEALRLLLKQEFAVMLLDVQMPGMDGYEVAQHARDNPDTREVPVIFVTATHETKESVLRGYDAGAFDLLFKPIDPYVLRSKVQVFLDLYLGRRRLQPEIAAHQRTLAEVEAFNYSVSHDLRAPLRPLDGFSKVLIEDYADKLDDRGRTTSREFGRPPAGWDIIDDLLELSRVSRTNVSDSRSTSRSWSTRLPKRSAATASTATGRSFVPRPDRQRRSGLLRIVLENLLRNAWKFTQKRPQPRIEVGRTAASNEVAYFVRDNGVGFDASYASKLFQPFQRLHGAEFAGTGIGLAIVDRIINRHGGRIWGESTAGEGATFFFTLPPG